MTELLFEREARLRKAARDYAHSTNDDTRKALRTAAVAFADLAKEIDEACQREVAS